MRTVFRYVAPALLLLLACTPTAADVRPPAAASDSPPTAVQQPAQPHRSGWHRPHALDYPFRQAWFDPSGQRGWGVSSRVLRFERGTWTVDEAALALAEPKGPLEGFWIAEDGRQGWAISHEDRVLRLRDGEFSLTAIENTNSPNPLEVTRMWVSDDGRKGWAVGGDRLLGAIYQLDNGAWHHHQTAPRSLWKLWVAGDGDSGWAVGPDGLVMRLADGRWAKDEAASALTPNHLGTLAVSDDGSTGWAVSLRQGGAPAILKLEHGHWRLHDPIPGLDLSLLSLWLSADGRHGWATGEKGRILRLRDGTWAVDEAGSALSVELLGIAWVEPSGEHALVTGRSEVLEYQDRQWRRRDDWGAAAAGRVFDAWLAPDGERGFAVSTDGILELRDGRWRALPYPVDNPNDNFLTTLWVSEDGERGFAHGSLGYEAVLEDGRWRDSTPASAAWPAGRSADALIVSRGGGHAWRFSSGEQRTLAEGGRWIPVRSSWALEETRVNGGWLSDDGERGYVGTSGGWIVGLSDGRWESDTFLKVAVNRLHMADDGDRGWAVGNEGLVARFADGQWARDEVASGLTDEDLFDVWLSEDGHRGVIVGDHGTVIERTAKGWALLPSEQRPTRRELRRVVMDADGSEGWALGWGRAHYVRP